MAEDINILRSKMANNQGNSYATQSCFGPSIFDKKCLFCKEDEECFHTSPLNSTGPIVTHYATTKVAARKANSKLLYLISSGGQYLTGTTIMTRTVHFGEPTEEQKELYTKILLGNLSVERAKWNKTKHLTGNQIYLLSKGQLFFLGLDTPHLSGHSVSHFGRVKETFPTIKKGSLDIFVPGMVVTNSPGIHQARKFIIRIENQLAVELKWQDLVGFRNLTRIPYCKKLLKYEFLSRADIEYINNYHEQCLEDVKPYLLKKGWKKGLEYLENCAEPI